MPTATPHAEDDGFTSVTYKKPTRTPKNRKGKNRFVERTLEEKLAAREAALRRSGYLSQCRELLRNSLSPPPSTSDSPSTSACPPPTCVVCLGLGSVSDSTKAQDQYILLKELLLELDDKIDKSEPVQFYDPVFSAEDSAFLTSQGHKVLSSNFPLDLTRPTLLYIPHGPRSLFNALLCANWTSSQLSRMIIFGNRLDLYDDPTYSGTTSQSSRESEKLGELEGGMEWIRKAAPLFKIVPLPSTKEHLEAFNDLALEWVEPSKLEQAIKDGRLPEGPSPIPTEAEETTKCPCTQQIEREQSAEKKPAEKNEDTLDESVEALQSLSLSAKTDERGIQRD